MRQVFVEGRLKPGASAELSGDDYHHLTRSLRAKPGEALTLVDSGGKRFLGILESIQRSAATVLATQALDDEPALAELSLALCAPKAEAFDASLDAATQLGATHFIPLSSLRSQRLPENRQARWQRSVREQCCQCLRSQPMQVLEPRPLLEFLAQPRPGLKLLAWQGGRPLPSLSPSGPVSLLLGPEGGFDDSELAAAKAAGWTMLNLGPRVLRVPVAVAAGLSLVQAMRAR